MTPKASNAEIIAELGRVKVAFQLRTIAAVIGFPIEASASGHDRAECLNGSARSALGGSFHERANKP